MGTREAQPFFVADSGGGLDCSDFEDAPFEYQQVFLPPSPLPPQSDGGPNLSLFHAVISGSPDSVDRSLADGADPNARLCDEEQPTALMVAVSSRCGATPESSAAVARALLVRGADPQAYSASGATALHWCASEECVQLLVDECGAVIDLERPDVKGLTPLHHACMAGRTEVARALLERGADPGSKDRESATPLHFAAKFDRPEVCSLLLLHGADVSAKHGRCSTALHFAAGYGNLRCLRVLLDSQQGVSVDVLGGGKQTPLHFAVHNRHLACAKLLIERGADPGAVSVWGTPIQMAINNDDEDMCRFLSQFVSQQQMQQQSQGSPPSPNATSAGDPVAATAGCQAGDTCPMGMLKATGPVPAASRVSYSADPTLPETGAGMDSAATAAGSVYLAQIAQAFPHLVGRPVFFNGAETGAVLCAEGLRHADGSVYTTPTSFTRRLSGSRSSGWKQLSVIVEKRHVPLWYYKSYYVTNSAGVPGQHQPPGQQALFSQAQPPMGALPPELAAPAPRLMSRTTRPQTSPTFMAATGRLSPLAAAPLYPMIFSAFQPSAQQPITCWKMPPSPGSKTSHASLPPSPVNAVRMPSVTVRPEPPGIFYVPPQPSLFKHHNIAQFQPPHSRLAGSSSGRCQSADSGRPLSAGSPLMGVGPVSLLMSLRGNNKPSRSFRLAGRIPSLRQQDVVRHKDKKVGATGSLYEGFLRTSETRVLVQKFKPEVLKGIDPKAELAAHCMLHHPHVLTLYGFYTVGGSDEESESGLVSPKEAPIPKSGEKERTFLLLEYADKTLRQWLTERSNTPPDLLGCVEMAHGIARALKALYNTDGHTPLLCFTPDSVLLTPDEIPKICDFSLCEWLLGGATTATPSAPLRYRAPEMYEADASGARAALGHVTTSSTSSPRARPNELSDVFTFGMVLYELLTGNKPFAELGDTEYASTRSATGPSMLPMVPASTNFVTGHLSALMTMCWREQPIQRPSFSQVVDILDNLQPHVESVIYWSPSDKMTYLASVAAYLRHAHNEFTEALEDSKSFLFGTDWRSALDAPLQAVIRTAHCDCTSVEGLVTFINFLHTLASEGKLPLDVMTILSLHTAADGGTPAASVSRKDVPPPPTAADDDKILRYFDCRIPRIVEHVYRVLSKDDQAECVHSSAHEISQKYSPKP